MDIIKRLPTRKKISGIALTVTFLCLAAGLTLMVFYQYRASKMSFLKKVQQQAALIGGYAQGGTGRISQRNAQQALTGFQDLPFILSGGIYNSARNLLAEYDPADEFPAAFTFDPDTGFRFQENILTVVQPVLRNSQTLGYVVIRASTDSLNKDITPYIMAAALIFLFLMLAAYGLTRGLRGIASRPVEKLVRTTQKIAGPSETKQIRKKQKNEMEILKGRIDYLIEIADLREMNIDKVKETQKQYQTAREFLSRYREYFEHSAAGIITLRTEDKGKNFIISDCNTEAERLVYTHKSDLINKRASSAFPGLADKNIRKTVQEVWESGESGYLPYIQFKPKKYDEWSELYIKKLPSGKLILVFHDATQKKKEEEARKKREAEQKKKLESQAAEQLASRLKKQQAGWEDFDRELNALFNTLAQDLAVPLDRIDDYSQSLLKTQSPQMDDQGKNDLIQIRAAEHRMKQFFKELKSLEKISQKKLKPEMLDLSAMVRKKTAELRDGNPNRKVKFDVQEELKAKGDPDLIRTAMDHLLTNAWNFTAQNRETQIEFGRNDQSEIPEFFIRDNGIGFPQEDAEKIFQPFVKLNPDDVYPGAGMGLAAARRIIHKHFGTIRAEGQPDKGAAFYFTLSLD